MAEILHRMFHFYICHQWQVFSWSFCHQMRRRLFGNMYIWNAKKYYQIIIKCTSTCGTWKNVKYFLQLKSILNECGWHEIWYQIERLFKLNFGIYSGFFCAAKIVKILFIKSTSIDKNVLKSDEVGWLRRRIEQVEERGRWRRWASVSFTLSLLSLSRLFHSAPGS